MNPWNDVHEKQKELIRSGRVLDLSYRKERLRALQRVLKNRTDDLLEAMKADFHKPEFEGYVTEVGFVLDELRRTLKHLNRWARPKRVGASLASFPGRGILLSEPLGRVLIISPWNYPVNLSLAPVVAAVAAGNTVVLHPSDETPRTAAVLESVIAEAFPDGMAAVVAGGVETAAALTKESWDLLFFTGSTRVGRIVYQEAAKNLTPVVLELGGKSPCVVSETASVRLAARRIVWGKFTNAGQTCVAPDYLLVHRTLKEEFQTALIDELDRVYGGLTAESEGFAHIVNDRSFFRLREFLKDGRILYGGDSDESSRFIAPTVIDDVSWSSGVMREEIFGPILPILYYDEETEIYEHVANSPDPLAFYFFGTPGRQARRLLTRIPYGGGCLNDAVMHLANTKIPFGGRGTSGLGQYHGKYGFETFSHRKPVHSSSRFGDPGFRYGPKKPEDIALAKLVLS